MRPALRRSLLLLIWLLVLLALGIFAQQRLQVSTDLRGFMPPPQTDAQQLLMDQVGEGPGSRLLLLAIAGAPQQQLADISNTLTARLRSERHFAQVFNGAAAEELLDTELLPWRYLLTPSFDKHPLDADLLRDALQQRLDELASPASTLLKPLLPRDPTLEVLVLAERWAPADGPQLHHGVWFGRDGEALLLAQTHAAGFDPDAQRAAIDVLQAAFDKAAKGTSARLEISGPGYFSLLVNDRVRSQATRIAWLSSLGFVALLLLAYRSLIPVLLTALPLLTGALAGIGAISLVFGQVHGITLAFGFTLLGVAQEYPLRLFSHRRAGESAQASMRRLWPLLLTAVVSACIAYLAFFASGVGGLQQLALFTIVGLLAAALCTRWLLPPLLPTHFHDAAHTPGLTRLWRWLDGLPRPRWVPWVATLAAVAMLWLAPTPFWQNDLAALTPVPQSLLLRDAQLRGQLGAPDVRYLLVLRGADAQDVLRLGEQLQPQLDALVEAGALAGADLPSRYLPSLDTQRARQAALPDAATLRAELAQAQQGLPFRDDLFTPFLADVGAARELPAATPQVFSKSPLGARLDAMLQEGDDGWLGLGTLHGVVDASALNALAQGHEGQVHLLDLKAASESLVSAYRQRILFALGGALVLLALTVALAFRNVERMWHVLAPMIVATLLVLAVERISGVSISLFHLVALTLAAGLGLHYALFFERVVSDEAEAVRTLHGTLVCGLSALLVFALLAWSSVPVLRAIGLTVSLGVTFHFTLSILMARKRWAGHAG